jgi:hypothetical protein
LLMRGVSAVRRSAAPRSGRERNARPRARARRGNEQCRAQDGGLFDIVEIQPRRQAERTHCPRCQLDARFPADPAAGRGEPGSRAARSAPRSRGLAPLRCASPGKRRLLALQKMNPRRRAQPSEAGGSARAAKRTHVAEMSRCVRSGHPRSTRACGITRRTNASAHVPLFLQRESSELAGSSPGL